MKRVLPAAAALVLTGLLSLWFFLTPEQLLLRMNNAEGRLLFSARESSGNLLTGYRFGSFTVARADGLKLIRFEELHLRISPWPLLRGRIGVTVRAEGLNAGIEAGLDRSLAGAAQFRDLPIDSAPLSLPPDLIFETALSGRVTFEGRRADIEFRSGQIAWKKLALSGIDLPKDIFQQARGALSVEPGRIAITSLALEGSRGYARLSGDMAPGRRNLTLELFPRDWNDPLFLPLEAYKASPGQYRIGLN